MNFEINVVSLICYKTNSKSYSLKLLHNNHLPFISFKASIQQSVCPIHTFNGQGGGEGGSYSPESVFIQHNFNMFYKSFHLTEHSTIWVIPYMSTIFICICFSDMPSIWNVLLHFRVFTSV